MRVRRLAWLIVGAIALVGCSSGKPASSGAERPRQCGKEENIHGEGYDSKARACLWRAVSDGKPVAFTTTIYTVEGDPITYTLQAMAANDDSSSRFTVLVDSKDKFGSQGLFTYACKGIERVAYQHAPQRYGFQLSDCTGTGDETEVFFP